MKVLVLFDLARPVGPDETFSNRALREEEDRATEADVISALGKLGHQVETLAVYDDALAVVKKVQDSAPDVVFNLCESFFNEEQARRRFSCARTRNWPKRFWFTTVSECRVLSCRESGRHDVRYGGSPFQPLSSLSARSLRTASRRRRSDGTRRIRSSAPVFYMRNWGATS